nr:hypothetical protein HUO10_000526 [Paraburkholderia busanensis]
MGHPGRPYVMKGVRASCRKIGQRQPALRSDDSTADWTGKLTGEVQRNFSARRARSGQNGQARDEQDSGPRPGTKMATAYRVRGRRLRYADVTDAVRRASYDHHGGVDRDRGGRRCATSHRMRDVRQAGCGDSTYRCLAWARARSRLCRRKAGHGRASVPVSLQAFRQLPVQQRSSAHSAKPLPSSCSLRGAANGYLKCVYRPQQRTGCKARE